MRNLSAKHKALMAIGLAFTTFSGIYAFGMDSRAEAQKPIVQDIYPLPAKLEPVAQVETFTVVPTPTPKPTYKEQEELPSYQLDEDDVETLCRLLWSSPLRSKSEKVKLLWVVFNRVDHGYPFGSSVEEVVNSREFTFFDKKARVSDKNRDIVTEELTRWMALKDGYGIGWHPSRYALYCRFVGENNRHIEIMADPYGEALQW